MCNALASWSAARLRRFGPPRNAVSGLSASRTLAKWFAHRRRPLAEGKASPYVSGVTHRRSPMAPARRIAPCKRECGFTRVELLVVVCVVVAVGLMLLLALPHSRAKSDRLQCISNLGKILVAEFTWMNDGAKSDSHWRTSLADGGTLGHAQAHHAWFQWSWISNHLGSPKVLVCPADPTASVATAWGESAADGLLNAKFQDATLSYLINMSIEKNVLRERPGWPAPVHYAPPHHALAGDYTVRVDGLGQACDAHAGPAYVCVRPLHPAHWEPPPHKPSGNLAFMDGSVSSSASLGLTPVLTNAGSPYQSDARAHLLVPARH
jgi:hypothetical protein